MVASIATLGSQLAAGSAPFNGGYFMSLANEDYYTTGGEPPGRWFGEGAAALALSGLVESAAFKNVLAGLRPEGGKLPGSRRTNVANSDRVPGYDLCFSAPKSVSTMWAAAPPEVQRQIEIAFDIAVRTTLRWLEQNVPLVRRGRGGCWRQFAELVVAQFDHATSRVAKGGGFEPQLHRHCVVANIARGQDGRWSAVNSRALHEWTRTLGPMFRATLAEQLQTRLAVGLVRPQDARGRDASWFEVAGVPAELCRRWSSRRDEIEQLLEGTKGGVAAWSRAQAREAANLASRSTKTKIPPRAELFPQWREEAERFGFAPRAADLSHSAPVDKEAVFQEAWRQTTATLDKSQSTFTYREAVQRVCEAAQTQGVSGAWLADRLATFLHQSPEIRLIGEVSGETRYVTEKTWQLEQKLLAEIDKLTGASGAIVKPKIIEQALASRPDLLPEQRDAARQLLKSREAIRALAGVAGAGKSFTLDVVREAFEKAGYCVIGGALAGVAKEELAAKAGIESRTIASYLHHFNKSFAEKVRDRVRHDTRQLLRALQGKPTYLPTKVAIDKNTVLIIDEAGMIDAKTFRDLCKTVRERGGTIVFVGDTAQLQPIAAGGPFRHLLEKLSPARLTTNLRQRDDADRRAADQLRRGEAKPALQNFAARERLIMNIMSTLATKLLPFEPIAAAWDSASETFSLRDWVAGNWILVLGNYETGRTAIDSINRCIFKRASDLTLNLPNSEDRRCWFFLDELSEAGGHGGLPGLIALAKKGRSKGAALAIAFQSVSGLRDPKVYGQHFTDEILGQIANRFFGRIECVATAEWASSLFGDEESERATVTNSHGPGGASQSVSRQVAARRLVMPGELMSLEACNRQNGLSAYYIVRSEGAYFDQIPGDELFTGQLVPPRPDVAEFLPRPASAQYLAPWTPAERVRYGEPARKLAAKRDQEPSGPIGLAPPQPSHDAWTDLDETFG